MSVDPQTDIIIYHGTGEWSALYLRGKLQTVGDTYLVWEKLVDILDIEEVHNDDFMQGGDHYIHVAKTLGEVRVYEQKRVGHENKQQQLIDEAATLEAQAKEIRARAAQYDTPPK